MQENAIVEVERADFGPHVQANEIARDRRLEIQADTELLENDRDRRGETAARDDGNRELPAGEKAGFLAVIGNQVRLGETLKIALLLQCLEQPADVLLGVEQEQVQKVAEHQALVGVEDRRRVLLGCAATDPAVTSSGAGEERHHGIENVGGGERGREGRPAAGRRRLLARAPRQHGLPVGRHHLDLETATLEHRLGDRRGHAGGRVAGVH